MDNTENKVVNDVELAEAIGKAVNAAVQAMPHPFDVNNVVGEAIRAFRNEQSRVLWTLFGLENTFGEWRPIRGEASENSPIQKYLRKEAEGPIKAFLDAELGNILAQRRAEFEKKLAPEISKHIKEYLSPASFHYEIRNAVHAMQRGVINEIMAEQRESFKQQVMGQLQLAYKPKTPEEIADEARRSRY